MGSLFYRNLKRNYPKISFGRGVWLTDKQNKSYLDGCSGAVVANVGHGVSEVNEAIAEQLSRIAFAHSSQFVSDASEDLAERLISKAPSRFQNGGKAYFVSGGSEAIETAIKMARGFFFEKGLYEKSIVISRWNSYHGSTIGALSATGHPARRTPYQPLLADDPHISPAYPYRCSCGSNSPCDSEKCAIELADELEAAISKVGSEKVLAFVVEPVVGAALGAVAPQAGYFKRIREICDRHGVLLIADEVMTGLGRIGADFGLAVFDIEADIIALGKGLSAGYMPLGAVLASAAVADVFARGTGVFEHGFTYSAHPVACAAGVAVMKYMDEHNLNHKVGQLETELRGGLSGLKQDASVGDVRGKGFLWGVEFVSDRESKSPFAHTLRFSHKVAAAAAELGLLVYPGSGSVDGVRGDHIIVAPPYTITVEELGELFSRLSKAVSSVSKSLAEAQKN